VKAGLKGLAIATYLKTAALPSAMEGGLALVPLHLLFLVAALRLFSGCSLGTPRVGF